MRFEAISYPGGGVQVVSGATSATVAIPQTTSGKTARFVGVQTVGQTYAYVKFGPTNTVTATANDFPVTSNELRIFDVGGQSFMAFIQETAGAKINLCPIEF
ncbi:MAG TPA: hypothetical protein VFA50_13220 [Stellaceae bacterium]|nr:hypothetical protein [Stellaceae bacterium]